MVQSKFDQDWELALKEREKQKPSFQKLQKLQKHTYFFGITLKKGKPIYYLVRDEVGKLPEEAFNVKKFEALPADAPVIAEKLLAEWNGIIQREVEIENISPESVLIPTNQDDVRDGLVVRHVDKTREHLAITLRVRPNGNVCCLFFTSNPEWNERSRKRRSRKATKEEITLAGMVTSKITYLASTIKHVSELFPTGVEYPSDRVFSLYKEFYPDAWDLQE